VRAATCKRTGRAMAVKVIPKAQHSGKPKELRRLRDEIRVLASLRHPNIMPMLCAYETATHLLLVMERAHGGELFDRIVSRGSFTERDAATVMVGLLSALAHLHGHGVMHRDVKPENLLLLDHDGWQVKLSDFGLVRVMEGAWERSRRRSSASSLGIGRGGKGRSAVLPGIRGRSDSASESAGGGVSPADSWGSRRVSGSGMGDDSDDDDEDDDEDDNEGDAGSDGGGESGGESDEEPPPPPSSPHPDDDLTGASAASVDNGIASGGGGGGGGGGGDEAMRDPNSWEGDDAASGVAAPLTLCGSSYYVAPEVLSRDRR